MYMPSAMNVSQCVSELESHVNLDKALKKHGMTRAEMLTLSLPELQAMIREVRQSSPANQLSSVMDKMAKWQVARIKETMTKHGVAHEGRYKGELLLTFRNYLRKMLETDGDVTI